MNFSAVLLAGGRSSRLGRDKAWLPMADGRPLIEHQLAKLRALRPAGLFISGRSNTDYAACGARVLLDEISNAGPLAGVERALAVSTAPLVLVLAVDLPRINSACLDKLVRACAPDRGVVPARGSFYEPLAAVYPTTAKALAREMLESGRHALHEFVQACEARGWVALQPIAADESDLFTNWNESADISSA